MPKLTLQQLEPRLWGATDILRARIDSGDSKRRAESSDQAISAGSGGSGCLSH